MGPHRQGTRRSSSRRLSSFTESPGRPTRRWRAGRAAMPEACPTGSRRPTRPIADGRRPVPDGRGPAQAQARERAAEEGERDAFKSERLLRRQAAAGESAKRAKFEFIFPSEGRRPVSEMRAALGATRRGHCARKGRPPSAHAMRDGELAGLITRGGSEVRGIYGAPEAFSALRRMGVRTSMRRTTRIMRERAKRPSGEKRAAKRVGSKTRSSASSAPTAPTWCGSPTSLA